MDNKYTYKTARCNGDAHYGTKCIAEFHTSRIIEGESFDESDFQYIDDLGPGWQKGHLIAKSLGGCNKASNLLPMTENVNNSEYKAVENTIKKLIDCLPGIRRILKDPDAYIHYEVNVTNDKNKYVKIGEYKFPAELSYSIKLCRGDGIPLPDISTSLYIKMLRIELSKPLLGVIKTDRM